MTDQRSGVADRREHNHYFKDVKDLEYIDVYMVLKLFQVIDPAIQHAIKKLLVAGGRGAGKDTDKDIKEAIDSLLRCQEMRAEMPDVNSVELQFAEEHELGIVAQDSMSLALLRQDIKHAIAELDSPAVDTSMLDHVNRNRAPEQQFPTLDAFEQYREDVLETQGDRRLAHDIHSFLVQIQAMGFVTLRPIGSDSETLNGQRLRKLLRSLREAHPELTA